MTQCNRSNHRNHLSQGFTLVELIVVIGLFGFGTALLMQNLFSIYRFKEVIRSRKEINFEASSALNNGIAGLIRSGFAINYPETDSKVSDGSVEGADNGMRDKVDKISIFTDRAETRYFTLYRGDRQKDEDGNEYAQLMLRFSDDANNPIALHSSETVVEDFDVKVPSDPLAGGDRELQPYVSLYLRVTRRPTLGRAIGSADLPASQVITASYRTTFTLRNTVPSSYKKLSLVSNPTP